MAAPPKKPKQPKRPTQSTESAQPKKKRKCSPRQSSVKVTDEIAILSQRIDEVSRRTADTNAKVAALHDEFAREARKKQSTQCIVCMDAEREVFYLSCGHLLVCAGCDERLEQSKMPCPNCRKKINGRFKVFK